MTQTLLPSASSPPGSASVSSTMKKIVGVDLIHVKGGIKMEFVKIPSNCLLALISLLFYHLSHISFHICDLNTYWPISKLPCLPKILESAVFLFREENKVLQPQQSSFRRHPFIIVSTFCPSLYVFFLILFKHLFFLPSGWFRESLWYCLHTFNSMQAENRYTDWRPWSILS